MYSNIPGLGRNSNVVGPVTKTCADGVIVGSSIVEMIDAAKETKDFSKIEEYLKDLHRAIN